MKQGRLFSAATLPPQLRGIKFDVYLLRGRPVVLRGGREAEKFLINLGLAQVHPPGFYGKADRGWRAAKPINNRYSIGTELRAWRLDALIKNLQYSLRETISCID